MADRLNNARILIYCHDTLGLGHLRRCRTIAQSLVANYKGLSVLMVSGSPIIGAFDFKARVDFVRIPGVIKLRNGEYSSLSLDMDIAQIVDLRASIIHHTAKAFHPDLFIVDKEPLGFRGEIAETLQLLRERGTPIVLGLRDVMDEPNLLGREWERKGLAPALETFYDEIWVYGLPQMCDPLEGTGVPETVRGKMIYTGYLPRSSGETPSDAPIDLTEPYLLVTTGGGGDGDQLIDWVLRAYESDSSLPHRVVMLFGPFMPAEKRIEYAARADGLDKVTAMTFDSHIEPLMENADGLITMGGYNTFCEILSFDKPALVVPRTMPRLEQFIRARRAEELGLVKVLPTDSPRRTTAMVEAIKALPAQPRPSEAVVPGLLEGLDNINRLVSRLLGTVESERSDNKVTRLLNRGPTS